VATYNISLNLDSTSSPGDTETQNVLPGDTINLTVDYTVNTNRTYNAAPTDCEVNGSTSVSTGNARNTTVTIDTFTGSSYNVLVTSTNDGTTFYYANLSGTVASVTAPVVNNSQSFAATASATTTCAIALTSSGSGGTLQYNKSTSTTVPTSGWQSSSTVSVTRGTSYYFWARRGVGSEDRTDASIPVPYIAPDTTSVSGTDDNIAWADTTATTSVTGVLSNHTYIIKKNNGSYRRSDTFTADGNVTISDQEVADPPGLPPQASTDSIYFYEFVVYRNENVGGEPGVINANGTLSGGWTDTNRTFKVTREKDPIPPEITVVGATTVNVTVGDTYTDAGATATDNFSPATPTVTVNSTVDTSVIGSYTVTYDATDDAGNSATQKTRTVNVLSGTLGDFNVNQTNVDPSSTNYAYAQYSGSANDVLAARTDGDATFVVTASATQPNTSLFDTLQKNIADGDFLHVKQTASSNFSTAKSSTFRVGGAGGDTSTHTVTTRAGNIVPTGWNNLTLGDKNGANLGSIWYLNFDGTFTTTSPGTGFTMSGLEQTITGTTSGTGDQIRKNTGSWTTSNTTFSNTDVLYARITASSSYSSGRTQTLTAGGGDAKDWTLTTKATPVPDAFDLGDTAGTTPTSGYTSNTITISGLDSGQTVTVSFTSDSTGSKGYYKNGAISTSTSAVNGDTFAVYHVANPGNSTVTSSSLNIGGTSDTFTTTNSANTGAWGVNKLLPAGTPNEGTQVTMNVAVPTYPSDPIDFWWSVSPTDVDASTGSGTTTYSAASKGTSAANRGSFNFTANEDYTDDGAAGGGNINYTVNVYSDANRTDLKATTTVAIADTSLPLPPDRSINTIADQTFEYAAGSDNGHSVSIINGENHTTYASAVDGTTTELGTVKGAGSSAATLTVADDNIAPGKATLFQILARRTVADLGNNVAFVTDPKRTYTISRKALVPTVTDPVLTDPNLEDDDITMRWNISGGQGTLEYNFDGEGWVAGSGNIDKPGKRGTSYTFLARSNDDVDSNEVSKPFQPGYLNPATVASGNLIRNADQNSHTISTGSAADYLSYRVLSIGVVRGSAVGGTDITVTDVTLPGSNLTHTIQGKREVEEGGDGTWKSLDTYVIIKRPGPPTTIGLGNDPGTEASEALFTVTASGSLDDDAVYTVSTDNNSWAANVSELLLTRVSDTIYARATGENGQISGASFAVTVPHLNPKSFSISNNDTEVIAAGTTQFAVGISGADTDHSYRILYGVTTPVTLADERTTDGNLIVDGAGIPNKGNDMNYAIQVKRGLDSGGNNQWVQTSTFTKKRSIDDPIITVFDDEAASPTVLVTVESSAVSNVTGDADAYQAQGDPDADGTFTSYENMDGNRRKTYSQLRNQSLADYRVKAKGANDTETTATFTNYDPGYLEPFKSVTLTSNTLIVPQADTTATVVVNGVENSTDVVSVRANNGSTDLATETPTNGTATISFNHGLAIGGSSTFEIFIKRDTDTGGDGSTFYQTNVTFTVERLDTTPDAISFGADITTAARGSVHYASTQVTGITTSVTVSSAGGSSIPFFVSNSATASTTATDYNNNAKTANNNDYIHLRAVASTNYSTQKQVTISVGSPAESDTWRVTTLASASPFDLGEPSESPSRINTVYTSNIITVAGLDTGQTSAATVTGGEFRKNSGAWRTAAETVQNDDTLQVRGTSAETYDGTTVDVTLNLEGRSDTFSITTETKPTIPTGISITNDTTTPSDVVSLSCTAEGGSGGTLRISEDDNTYDADATANFNFTRGSAKTLYAKRFGTFINSDLFTRAAFTLAYIPATTGITATPTSPASSNIDMQVVISNGNSLETYSVYNSSKTTLLGFRTGNGTITFTDASLQDNNTNTYAVQVRRDVNVGGNGNLVDTGVTFDIAYDSNVANVPPSISVSASSYTPAINTSVTLTATATDNDGSISSIAWTQLSGPTTNPSPASNANSNSLTSTITTPNFPTTLRYKATATDNASASTDSSILEIQVAGGSDYGFEVYNASGNTILSVNSTVPRIVAAGNAGQLDFSAGNTYTQNVSVAGMSNDGTWEVLIYTPYLALAVAHEVTISSGQFTITTVVQSNGGTGSLTIYYYVLRI